MQQALNDPIEQFSKWIHEAKQCALVEDATAMNLATSSKNGEPSNRIVLLKAFDQNGFVFYTNLNSKKSMHLKENPKAALCFYWPSINKQIRIQGLAKQISDAQADVYFSSRPIESRIGAWESRQSETMNNAIDMLRNIVKQALKNPFKYKNRPSFWSGFCVHPEKIEFWERGHARIHNRTLYTKHQTKWFVQKLYP